VTEHSASQQSRLPKASDILANTLTIRILSEGLKEGSCLPPEAALIQQYQFSRGTVREALRLLESDGLVRIRRGPKGGVEVAMPDISRVTQSLAILLAIDETPLRHLVDFRSVVEPASAALAARDATAAQREALVRAVSSDVSDDGQDPVDFHRLVGEATNNGFMRTILSAVHRVVEWETRRESLNEAQLAETQRSHRKIAVAISEGDAGSAERAMKVHLLEFRKVLDMLGRLDEPIVPRPKAPASTTGLGWS
jgi:GntR family transcriptional repressor for pyruvate dehydrogenase complex